VDLKIFDVERGACALLTTDTGQRVMIDCGHIDDRQMNGWFLVWGIWGCGTFAGLCDAQWCFVVTTATDAPRRGLRKYQSKQSTKISLDKCQLMSVVAKSNL
jgi:hypothetical protein